MVLVDGRVDDDRLARVAITVELDAVRQVAPDRVERRLDDLARDARISLAAMTTKFAADGATWQTTEKDRAALGSIWSVAHAGRSANGAMAAD